MNRANEPGPRFFFRPGDMIQAVQAASVVISPKSFRIWSSSLSGYPGQVSVVPSSAAKAHAVHMKNHEKIDVLKVESSKGVYKCVYKTYLPQIFS
jgi:hypothetical protein